MRKMAFIRKKLWMLAIPFILIACEDKMDEHYEVPEGIKNAWEILSERGNYSIFLKGVELAGFEPMVNGKNILTIMAPNDEAFSAFLKKEGKNSIEEYSEQELVKLIGYHLLTYSYTKDKLVNFRPSEGDNATEEDKLSQAGMFYKHRTKSSDPKSLERDTTGDYVFVYHQERYLPVFSYKYFETKKIDPVTNYKYFYPNSEWTGTDGFNVSNASVTEYSLPATNGYVYLVDRVVEPLETIYKELQTNENYSTFLDLYDQYKYYYKDEALTTDYGNGYDLYLHYHASPLPNIACEWSMSSYTNIMNLCYTSYSIFAPSNKALKDLFTNFWSKGGYTSLKNVNSIAMQSLLYNCVYSGPIAFPEEIKNKTIENNYGIPITFDTESVPQENRVMCCNGVLYELEEINYPAMFTAITGPAFQYKKYIPWLNVLNRSLMLAQLVSDNATFTMLIPSDEQLQNAGIEMVGDVLSSSSTGELASMSSAECIDYTNANISIEKTTFQQQGTQVVHTNIPFNYWYIKNGKITSSTSFNDILLYKQSYTSVFYNLQELKNNGNPWSNGKVYAYDAPIAFQPLAQYPSKIQKILTTTNDNSALYGRFAELLKIAGLKDFDNSRLSFLPKAERCLIFIPSNNAIQTATAEGRIPGLNKDGSVQDSTRLANYLQCYFVKTANNGISEYVYPGWGSNGVYMTAGLDTTISTDGLASQYTRLRITDSGASISVQRITNEGEKAEVQVNMQYGGFPFTFQDGGVQLLTDVL